jgi:hypothetical protein
MREGRGLNHVGYAFLSFYRVLETAFPNDAKRIVKALAEQRRERDRTFGEEMKRNTLGYDVKVKLGISE